MSEDWAISVFEDSEFFWVHLIPCLLSPIVVSNMLQSSSISFPEDKAAPLKITSLPNVTPDTCPVTTCSCFVVSGAPFTSDTPNDTLFTNWLPEVDLAPHKLVLRCFSTCLAVEVVIVLYDGIAPVSVPGSGWGALAEQADLSACRYSWLPKLPSAPECTHGWFDRIVLSALSDTFTSRTPSSTSSTIVHSSW